MAGREETPDVKTNGIKRASPEVNFWQRKRFKTEELPLSAAQHTALENLLHSFKKKGGFDSVRKKIWADFDGGVCHLRVVLSTMGRNAHRDSCRNTRRSLHNYWLN